MGRYHDYGIKQAIDPGLAFRGPRRCMGTKIYLTDFEKYRNKITVNRVANSFTFGPKAWCLWFARDLVSCMVEGFEKHETTIEITSCFERIYFDNVSWDNMVHIKGGELLKKAIEENFLTKTEQPNTYKLVMKKKL